MRSWFAAIALAGVCASAAHAQKNSILVYETTTRTRVGMFGESVLKTRTMESTLGLREELVERSGLMGANASEGGDSFLEKPGSYRLSLASGMYFVDPASREYFTISDADSSSADMKQLEQLASGIDGKSRSDVDSLGPGDTVAGQPTSHWRIHEVTRMSMKAGTDSVITDSDMIVDTYFSTISRLAPEDLREPRAWSKGNREVPTTLELKRVKKGTMGLPGMVMPIEMSMDVTKLSRQGLDPALFAIPRGYKKVPMPGPRITIKDLP